MSYKLEVYVEGMYSERSESGFETEEDAKAYFYEHLDDWVGNDNETSFSKEDFTYLIVQDDKCDIENDEEEFARMLSDEAFADAIYEACNYDYF